MTAAMNACKGCEAGIPRVGRSRSGWCGVCGYIAAELNALDVAASLLRRSGIADRSVADATFLVRPAEQVTVIAERIRRQLRERSGPAWDFCTAYSRALDARRAEAKVLDDDRATPAPIVSIDEMRRRRGGAALTLSEA